MSLTAILTSPAAGAVYLLLACAALSATASATRLTHPRLSAWLAFFAAALPADVTRMKLGPALPPAPAQPSADEVMRPETRPAGEP